MSQKHTHKIEFIRFGEIPGHIHSYQTRTTINDRHQHIVRGNTSVPAGRDMATHVHYYEGTTSFDDGHVHHFQGWTSPPIPLPGGGHYHNFSGQTSFDDGHLHFYSGRTGEGTVARNVLPSS